MWNCSLFMSFWLVRGCLWKRLILVIFGQGVQFQCRLFFFGPGIDIWRPCRFIAAMMRPLCLLLAGLRRFVLCSIGAHHCRLRHVGWEKCGHGLTSRPRESASELFLDELLGLFRYPPGSGRALLAGTLLLRYCAGKPLFGGCRFLDRLLGWLLLALMLFRRCLLMVLVGEVHWVGGSGPEWKRIRLNRKPPAHLAGLVVQSRPRVWKRLRQLGLSGVSIPDHKRRRSDQDDG